MGIPDVIFSNFSPSLSSRKLKWRSLLFIQFKLYIFLVYFIAWLIDRSHSTGWIALFFAHKTTRFMHSCILHRLHSPQHYIVTLHIGCGLCGQDCTMHTAQFAHKPQHSTHHSWPATHYNLSLFFSEYSYFINYYILYIITPINNLMCIILTYLYYSDTNLLNHVIN